LINGYIAEGQDGINICIELNILDNKHNINWINDRRKGKDNFINELEFISNMELIENASEYAESKGYLKGIKEKYIK
jgi:hypothetical protein